MERDAELFHQFTAERVVTCFELGLAGPAMATTPQGRAEQALDTTVYAMVALHGLVSMGMRLNAEVEAVGAAVANGMRGNPSESSHVQQRLIGPDGWADEAG